MDTIITFSHLTRGEVEAQRGSSSFPESPRGLRGGVGPGLRLLLSCVIEHKTFAVSGVPETSCPATGATCEPSVLGPHLQTGILEKTLGGPLTLPTSLLWSFICHLGPFSLLDAICCRPGTLSALSGTLSGPFSCGTSLCLPLSPLQLASNFWGEHRPGGQRPCRGGKESGSRTYRMQPPSCLPHTLLFGSHCSCCPTCQGPATTTSRCMTRAFLAWGDLGGLAMQKQGPWVHSCPWR